MMLSIGFSSPKNDLKLFGRAIEVVEKRPFSHAFAIYKDPLLDIDMVFQASHGIVHSCTYEKHKEDNNIVRVYNLECSPAQFKAFYTLMLGSLGKPYAWYQIAGVFLGKIFRCKNPFKNDLDSDFCSQLMVYVCLILNIDIKNAPNTVTPSDLDSILSAHQGNNI